MRSRPRAASARRAAAGRMAGLIPIHRRHWRPCEALDDCPPSIEHEGKSDRRAPASRGPTATLFGTVARLAGRPARVGGPRAAVRRAGAVCEQPDPQGGDQTGPGLWARVWMRTGTRPMGTRRHPPASDGATGGWTLSVQTSPCIPRRQRTMTPPAASWCGWVPRHGRDRTLRGAGGGVAGRDANGSIRPQRPEARRPATGRTGRQRPISALKRSPLGVWHRVGQARAAGRRLTLVAVAPWQEGAGCEGHRVLSCTGQPGLQAPRTAGIGSSLRGGRCLRGGQQVGPGLGCDPDGETAWGDPWGGHGDRRPARPPPPADGGPPGP